MAAHGRRTRLVNPGNDNLRGTRLFPFTVPTSSAPTQGSSTRAFERKAPDDPGPRKAARHPERSISAELAPASARKKDSLAFDTTLALGPIPRPVVWTRDRCSPKIPGAGPWLHQF